MVRTAVSTFRATERPAAPQSPDDFYGNMARR